MARNANYMLQRTDLNLLLILDTLLNEKSVSKTAVRLNVTPPAISKSLNKIRDTFRDQLLVRSGTRLELTPLAIQLKPQIHEIINNIQDVLNQNMEFNIGETSLVFTIVTNDILMSKLSYYLMKKFRTDKNNGFFEFKYDNSTDCFLRNENIDLYIGEARDLSPEVKIRTVCREKCLIISNKKHPILSEPKTLNNLSNYYFITTKGKLNKDIDKLFRDNGFVRKVQGISPGYLSAIETITQTDALAVVPVYILDTLKKLNIEVATFEPNIALPEVSLVQAWHPRNNNSPANKWLRDYIKDFFSSTEYTSHIWR